MMNKAGDRILFPWFLIALGYLMDKRLIKGEKKYAVVYGFSHVIFVFITLVHAEKSLIF